MESAVQVELIQPPQTITEDFLQRIASNSSLLTSEDIKLAMQAVIEADEKVQHIVPN